MWWDFWISSNYWMRIMKWRMQHWLRNFWNTVNQKFRKKSRCKKVISQSIENNFDSNCISNIIDMIFISKCTQKAFSKSTKIRNVLWIIILNSTVWHSNQFQQISRHSKCLIIIQDAVDFWQNYQKNMIQAYKKTECKFAEFNNYDFQ